MLKVGEMAPDFMASDHRGQTVRLGDYRGKIVLLWFYPRAGTPG
jgi:peroxiredoxin Q/BCP